MERQDMLLNSWGRYPEIEANTLPCRNAMDVADCLGRPHQWIPRGLGRSYGDSALAENVLLMTYMNRILSFDPTSGMLHCEGGVSIGDILSEFLPGGWFLPVTPGTRHVTVGGAIASDVHGKNHHVDGSFSQWVHAISLMLPNGAIVNCSLSENRELFLATCGGMGLTGVILSATLQMRRVTSACMEAGIVCARGLQEILDSFDAYASWPYLVAWVDCLAGGQEGLRALVLMGAHAASGALQYMPGRAVSIPRGCPGWILNRWSARCFNQLYFHLNRLKHNLFTVSVESFFYPLDRVDHWSRLYGRSGLLQYQFVLPKAAGFEGLRRILAMVNRQKAVPFLGVLKLLGEENNHYLSFPKAGYTLALDFKAESGVFRLLEALDAVVADYGGRVYLAKDARMPSAPFAAGYPRLDAFRQVRESYALSNTIQSLQSRRLGL